MSPWPTGSPTGPDPKTPSGRYRPTGTRRSNAGLLLGHLHRYGPRSRTDLVAETGLSKASVTSLVGDLVARDLLVECDVTHTGHSGRPSRPVDISGRWVEGIGIEITERTATGFAINLSGDLVAERSAPFAPAEGEDIDRAPGDVAQAIARVASDLLDAALDRGHVVAGLCLAVPAHLCRRAQPIRSPGWGPEVMAVLEQLTTTRCGPGVDVRADRSADLAAVAERRLGPQGEAATLVTIDGGAAVGGGVVLDGGAARGATGLVADVGHLVVAPDGERCWCGGRGCWETVVGVEAIVRQCCPDLAGNPLTLRSPAVIAEVARRARIGDAFALEGLERVGRWVGIGLASIVATLNPHAVVLDGSFRLLGPWLLDHAMAAFAAHAGGPALDDCFVTTSSLDGTAPRRGAAMRAVAHVVDDPESILEAASSVCNGRAAGSSQR